MGTKPLPPPSWMYFSSWHGPLPGASEFSALLETMTDATIVIDRTSRQVVFANQGFFELTGFDPLTPQPLSIDTLLPDFGEGWSSGEAHPTELLLLTGRKMSVWLSVTWLDKPGQWVLLQIVPLNVHEWRNMQSRREQDLLEYMDELAHINIQPDLDSALELVLRVGAQMLAAQGLCVYRAEKQTRRLVLVKTRGDVLSSLPESVPLDEPTAIYAPALWLKNQRPLTPLQHAARRLDLDSLVSVPIEMNGSRMGLLMAANLPPQNARRMIENLELLAAYIASALHHYITLNNLRRTLWEYSRSLATRDAIAAHSLEGIILLNPAARVVDLNPAAELMLGYATCEVVGQRVENILVGVETLPAALRLAQQGVASPDLGNVKLHRRSGQAFPAHLQVFPVQASGERSGIVLLIRDMSEHEEFRVRTQQLEQRALLGEVTAIFAHEVRNPINNLSTGLQLLEMNLPADDPNRELIGRLQNDCGRLTHLMESVLSFARPMEYKLTPTDVGGLLQRLLERWGPRMARLNVHLLFQVEEDTPPALADGRALDQVFTNLVSNALNAMQETGGTLAVKVEKVNAVGGKRWVSISVSDTGPGIPPEAREKVFEPFYTTNPQGTGLGLAITKRIVIAHKGKITLNSFPGGTIFTILLPAAESEEA
ncbi:MAG: ATP-binding protein [Anaerolineales bacterium]|nr:ATP-binding protein [Anaerolineales bacterium]